MTLEAPEGGLPRDNLEPLLRAHQGELLDPSAVRQDLALLYRVAPFEAVEAHVEPWFILDEDGEAQEAVNLSYRVYPAPRIRDLEIVGATGASRKIVATNLGLNRGGPLYTDPASGEIGEVEARITQALVSAGWPDARARLALSQSASERYGREVRVYIYVDPGEPQVISEVALAEGNPVPERKLRRWLRRAGVSESERVAASTLSAGRASVLDHLVAEGYLEARVNVVFAPAAQGGTPVSVLVDPGPKLELHRGGRGLPRGDALRDLLGLSAGDRLSQLPVDELEERVEAWYRSHGRFEAVVDIAVEAITEDGHPVEHVDIKVRRGRPHVLGKVSFEGAETFKQSYLLGALKEAAPETLGRKIVTREAVESALGTLRDFYRSEGFLDARLRLVDLSPGGSSLKGVRLDIVVNVDEGSRTTLRSLAATGGVIDPATGRGVAAAVLDKARAASLNQPYNPSQVDALARDMVLAYREVGYLNADVRGIARVDQGDANVEMLVMPGEQIRLRGVLIEGNRRTRRQVIERELRVTQGEPVTPSQIDETRTALYDLDLFRSVTPELVGDDDRSRDLILHLDERSNLLFELGGGLSTDEGVLLKGRAAHRNLGGLGQRLSLFGQAGYGWVGDTWTFNLTEPVWRAALRYEAPNLPVHGYRLVSELVLREAVQEPTWRLVRSGLSVGVQARYSEHSEAVYDYHIQRRTLEDVDPGALVQGEPWWPVDSAQPSTPTAARTQGGLGLLFVNDWRDDRFNPKRGTLWTTELELGDPLSNDALFFKGQTRLEQLIPLGPLVLELGGRGGLGWVRGARATLAVEDRFTLGGSSSLRGFKLDTVGPANRVERPDINFPDGIEPVVDGLGLAETPTHWVPTGGDTMAVLSAELRVPLSAIGLGSDSTSIVFFSDAGHVGFLDPTIITTSRLEDSDRVLRVSVGAGLHIATPIGPASLDLGLNLDPIDARDEPVLVPHLSLGAL